MEGICRKMKKISHFHYPTLSLHSLSLQFSSPPSHCCRPTAAQPVAVGQNNHQPPVGVPSDVNYPRIFTSKSTSNPDPDIIFFHICQYSYLYPKVRCRYGYGESNILFISDPISECWVLDNDICMEETIFQWNETIDFDILSW